MAWLTPLAAADRGGAAALELGLLQLSLGRRADAEAVAAGRHRAGVARRRRAMGRAARAAHALGRLQQANDLFRDAAAMAGDDPELQTAWGDLLTRSTRTPTRSARTGQPSKPTARMRLRMSASAGRWSTRIRPWRSHSPSAR